MCFVIVGANIRIIFDIAKIKAQKNTLSSDRVFFYTHITHILLTYTNQMRIIFVTAKIGLIFYSYKFFPLFLIGI